MRIKPCWLPVLFICFGIYSGNLQAQENDFQGWTDLKVRKDLGKKWDIAYEQNIRFRNNASQFNKSYSNLSAGYSVINFLKIEGLYRFVTRQTNDGTRYGHSVAIDLSIRQKYERLRLSLRNRVMYKYMDINSSELGRIPERYYRTKLEGSYKTRKFPIDPFASVESFLLLPKGDDAFLDALRTVAGLEFAPKKHHTFDIYWLNEWGLNIAAGKNLYVLGLSYAYSF